MIFKNYRNILKKGVIKVNISNICVIGKNEYTVKEKTDLCNLSRFAYVGSKAYCQEDKKVYIQTDVNEWVSM